MDYMEKCSEEMGKGKGKKRVEVITNKAGTTLEKIS